MGGFIWQPVRFIYICAVRIAAGRGKCKFYIMNTGKLLAVCFAAVMMFTQCTVRIEYGYDDYETTYIYRNSTSRNITLDCYSGGRVSTVVIAPRSEYERIYVGAGPMRPFEADRIDRVEISNGQRRVVCYRNGANGFFFDTRYYELLHEDDDELEARFTFGDDFFW